jgi:hypothetical protein
MVSLKVFNSVGEELRRIEQAYDVRVLYACESGSRAWGFASQDSDYDVRFIYVHSRDWYLSIEDRRDVIEEPISDNLVHPPHTEALGKLVKGTLAPAETWETKMTQAGAAAENEDELAELKKEAWESRQDLRTHRLDPFHDLACSTEFLPDSQKERWGDEKGAFKAPRLIYRG